LSPHLLVQKPVVTLARIHVLLHARYDHDNHSRHDGADGEGPPSARSSPTEAGSDDRRPQLLADRLQAEAEEEVVRSTRASLPSALLATLVSQPPSHCWSLKFESPELCRLVSCMALACVGERGSRTPAAAGGAACAAPWQH
jgi:hypothetical protein